MTTWIGIGLSIACLFAAEAALAALQVDRATRSKPQSGAS